MERPIITLLNEIVRAGEHCLRETPYLSDEDLTILFCAHVRLKCEEIAEREEAHIRA